MVKQIRHQTQEKTAIPSLIPQPGMYSSKKMAHGNQQVTSEDQKVTKAKMVQTEPMELPERLGQPEQQVVMEETEKIS